MENDKNEIMKSNYWNENITRGTRVIFLFLGILILFVTITYYNKKTEEYFTYMKSENLLILVTLVSFVLLGAVMIVVCFSGILRKVFIIFYFFPAVIIGILVSKGVRLGVVLFFISLLVYLICSLYKNIVSTFITYFLTLSIFAVLAVIIQNTLLANYSESALLLCYITLSVHLLFFRLFGVWLNKRFITFLGFSSEAEKYDDVQLKNQLFFLYFVVFVLLNVCLYIKVVDDTVWNLINNSFLTGLAIIQVDWNKINHFSIQK